MTDPELMQEIETKYGGFIADAVAGTPIPADLVAALVANESGLNDQAARFEPKVFGELAFVLIGRKPAFGSIGGQDLTEWIGNVSMDRDNGGRLSPQAAVVLALTNLATSWGPTQIMGYQALAAGYELSDLPNLKRHFHRAVELLETFRKHFDLPGEPVAGQTVKLASSTDDYEGYFHCWNAGSPAAPTFDPHYPANGLLRMHLYESISQEAP